MTESLQNNLILGLDDDPDFNNILKLVFKKNNIRFKATETPDQFASSLKNDNPTLCLIDLNLDVAQGAGFTMLQAIRNKFGLDLPIIIMSRRNRREDISKALELGANDYVPKPIDDTYLLQKVKQYLIHSEVKPLPFFKVTEKDWPCEISFDIQISSLNEFGITFSACHFLSKGTYLKVSGPVITEIFQTPNPIPFTIHNSWIDEETKKFMGFCEFDLESPKLLSNVRSYLLKNAHS